MTSTACVCPAPSHREEGSTCRPPVAMTAFVPFRRLVSWNLARVYSMDGKGAHMRLVVL